MPRCARIHLRSIGRALTRSSRSALPPLATHRTVSPRGYTSLFGLPHGHTQRRRAPPCLRRALQALHQPPRPRQRSLVSSLWVDAIRAQQFHKQSPPTYHVIQDDVSAPLQSPEVEKITGYQSVRGRDGVIEVMYETHWTGLSRPSWERETNLQLLPQQILLYWAGTPNQHRQADRLYGQMRIGAVQRKLSRELTPI